MPPRDGVGADAGTPDDGFGDWLTVTVSGPAAGVGVVRAVGEIDLLTARPWARTLDDTCRQLARHDDDPRAGAETVPDAGPAARDWCAT